MTKKLDLTGMKNILLVNTRSAPTNLGGQVMWGAWAVASYLKSAVKGADVKYLDENNEDDFRGKFEEALADRDTVGFSLTSMQIKYALPLIRHVKKKFPHIRVIIGGAHAILFPDQDYGSLVDDVVCWELPRDNFLYEFLPEKVKEAYRRERAQVLTGFNCSYKCTFCINSVRDCRYEPVPVGKILSDMDYVVREFNPKTVYFRDEDFFFDIKKAGAVVSHILGRGYVFKWEATSRVTNFGAGRITDELLERMVKSGCVQLRFGVESGSQKTLNALRKGQTVAHIKNAVGQCVKYGINSQCSFIIGIPGETAADREETYRLISDLHAMGKLVEILGPQIYRPYPGGKLYEEVKKYGLEFPSAFEDWAGFYDSNPAGSVFDKSPDYPWLSGVENKLLPRVWEVAHYGLNWSSSGNLLKKLVGQWFEHVHWRRRWFGGPDLRLFMRLRKKLLKIE